MTSRLRRVVIAGAGIAGLTAGEELRAAGFDGELILIGEEPCRPYSRPALSKALLSGVEDDQSHELPTPTHRASERFGLRATRLDPDARQLTLSDGSQLTYDGLVIATGAHARRLGTAASGELMLRNLADARALRDAIARRPTIAVIGGGPLGMEIASSCLAAGCRVTLVSDVAPLVAHLGAYLSELLIAAARKRGLRVIVCGSAAVVVRDGRAAVALPDGRVLAPDLVVTAAGDVPNAAWLQDSGLLQGGRLIVDSRGRVRPEIVAAGDVAYLPSPSGPRRLPLWTSAIDQAKVAARALLQGDDAAALDLQPYFWTEQFGLSLKACGPLPQLGEPDVLERGDDERAALLRWASPDGSGTAVAVNYKIAIPRLRRLAATSPTLA